MKPIRTMKTGLLVAAVVFGSVFLSSFEAQAENWIEIEPGKIWRNSDYTFVDRRTGFIVFEIAEANDDDTFSYFLDAIDCDSWVIYVLAVKDENGNYDIVPSWRTDPTLSGSIAPGSIINRIAVKVCPDLYNLPSAAITPQ